MPDVTPSEIRLGKVGTTSMMKQYDNYVGYDLEHNEMSVSSKRSGSHSRIASRINERRTSRRSSGKWEFAKEFLRDLHLCRAAAATRHTTGSSIGSVSRPTSATHSEVSSARCTKTH